MTTATQSLADFLLARLADDEAVALDCLELFPPDEPFGLEFQHDHQMRHGPARVLAEVEAKRHLVEVVATWAQQADYYSGDPGDMFAITYKAQAISGETVLRHLAAPYASHEDYRAEWSA